MVAWGRHCTSPLSRLTLFLATLWIVTANLPVVEAQPTTPAAQDVPPGRDPVRQLSRQYARRAAAQSQRRAATAITAPTAAELREPSVVMSNDHRATCLRFVGDVLPDANLTDAEGQPHSLAAGWGPRLTVVVCWNADNPYALDQFQEIPNELAPLREQGVHTVAIHVGPPPDDFGRLCQQHGGDALCLVDPDGKFFAQLATRKLPRTYVLDAHGTIRWLDLEYSRTTRYDLRNALHYFLQQAEPTSAP
ncbi:MAG: redoxin family protein [Pirellulaceae bacterium]|jgi:hypothetical protein|nr:redoxin family protein [Pirellulaceae bacterium]